MATRPSRMLKPIAKGWSETFAQPESDMKWEDRKLTEINDGVGS